MKRVASKPTTIRIDQDLIDALQARGVREERSVNWLVNRFLRDRLSADGDVSPERHKVRAVS